MHNLDMDIDFIFIIVNIRNGIIDKKKCYAYVN